MDKAEWARLTAQIERAEKAEAALAAAQEERDAARHESSLLRDLVRRTEPDRERMERFERQLTEIGRIIGCNHWDDEWGLTRCVGDVQDERDRLRAENAELLAEAEGLREKVDELECTLSDEEAAHRDTLRLRELALDAVRGLLLAAHYQGEGDSQEACDESADLFRRNTEREARALLGEVNHA